MRCINCQTLSLRVICKRCKEEFFRESIQKREVNGVEVVSLFGYSEVEHLILSKYSGVGSRIYRYFAREHLKPFLEAFAKNFPQKVYLIGIDEVPNKQGFSHIATLTHYSQTENIEHLCCALIAKNRVSYAKQSREFRLSNPRRFLYRGLKGVDVILVDDVITTGSTISQAIDILREFDVNILFALTVADAKR